MPFCPICKRNHNSNASCYDGAEQILQDIGINKSSKNMTRKKLRYRRQVEKEADQLMIKLFTVSAVIIIVAVLLMMIIPRLL